MTYFYESPGYDWVIFFDIKVLKAHYYAKWLGPT
jgi:hypothetical protein